MEAYIVEWLNLLGRWVHMITGIAWIGASFYFVWLDNHLHAPKDPADAEKGIGGEVWSLHGGGFYHAQKYKVAPAKLPEVLHWFKWEAYTTWMTGMFMLALIYWYSAEIYLIDPGVADISKSFAVLMGILTLVTGWLVYDYLCKSPLGQDDKKLGAAIFVFVTIMAFILTHLFSGRGAFIHFGAMLGTIMAANVYFIIMPGQQKMVEAAAIGELPDPKAAMNAKQRSVHNTYFTLPVLFTMISNHYAMTYSSSWNWLVLILISIAGALIRIYFVKRHFGEPSKTPLYIAGAIFLAIIIAMAPSPAPKPTADATAPVTNTAAAPVNTAAQGTYSPTFLAVQGIMQARCTSCHAAQPTQAGFSAPPKGVVFDTPRDIVIQATQIHQQTVATKAMPIGNLTKMTDEERAVIAQWYQSGAQEK
ncbi:MAG: FIG137887: membrane protein related to purine degradation [uncultured Thiotrichaceae bacterium]|uniref:FIG137887: membrane protein related to purine degradation n=1 Tax=uncultured Thiotrichaceae bacterium TaxID=298394 RepID=A0A6S6SYK5_9GAMM|nr:MAG: FIG137887: membrane protein related to purine degradation [uncultured Thiotrichaceae bacterium]